MRENAGYTIYSEFTFGFTQIVLGVKNDEFGDRYVTWEFTKHGQYYWGHYFCNEINAAKDFIKRCEELIKESET